MNQRLSSTRRAQRNQSRSGPARHDDLGLQKLKDEYDDCCRDIVAEQQALNGTKVVATVISWLLISEGVGVVQAAGQAMSYLNWLETGMRFIPTAKKRALDHCADLERRIRHTEAEINRQRKLGNEVFIGIRNEEGLLKTQRVRSRDLHARYAAKFKQVTGQTLFTAYADPFPDNRSQQEMRDSSNYIWRAIKGRIARTPRIKLPI